LTDFLFRILKNLHTALVHIIKSSSDRVCEDPHNQQHKISLQN